MYRVKKKECYVNDVNLTMILWEKPQLTHSIEIFYRNMSLKNGKFFVRFEVFTVVTMKNFVFLDVTPCGSC
jgi:hypothetical protein